MTQKRITDDLEILLGILPHGVVLAVQKADRFDKLLEIIIDLGRFPTARYVDGEIQLTNEEVTREQIDAIVEKIGVFDADNRAGLERTLHRISAIRNRRGIVVGLTLRVGRAVYGYIDVIKDLIETDRSILILGKPGVGKTTILREAARILSDSKRVIIVDTSNEIGGDGDVPHPAVGNARRMQVKVPTLQHEVMIEAVENHNPEVIVIDEIGRELEAQAARTIAERGVQLIGTAHGKTLENLLLNPTLSDLVGGIESVTLSDEEAKRRGTQKTVLERRAPPTFDVLIEIQSRDEFIIHKNITEAVDKLLRGIPLTAEKRIIDQDGKIHIKESEPILSEIEQSRTKPKSEQESKGFKPNKSTQTFWQEKPEPTPSDRKMDITQDVSTHLSAKPLRLRKIFPYGVARNRLLQAAKIVGVPVQIVRILDEADSLITLRSYYRDHQATIAEAESRGLPIYVLRSNTVAQIEQFMLGLFEYAVPDQPSENLDEVNMVTRSAIQAIRDGERYIDLPPAPANVRRVQHELAQQAELISHSIGKEPRRYVRIYRD
ncbi:MAG TPA: R3H domain-containing nucleic acid-binding protein [Anaerolineales bacterium]|nr:R3H domain-containing nucleic acid-binding protein [Anaerolineales bacterium]